MEINDNVHIMLQAEQEEQRLQGLKLLSSMDLAEHLPLLLSALGDDSWRVRKEAVELFLATPRAGVLAAEIVELLHSQDNAGLRNAAVEILTRLGRHSVPALLDELPCNDHDVRKFVIDILGDIGDISCLEPMIGALDDPDSNVRAAAAENLGKLGLSGSVPALLDAMEVPDLLLRFSILEALSKIGGELPVEKLLAYQDDKLLRKALFDCLGRVGGVEAVPALVQGLADPMSNVGEAAALALYRLCDNYGQQLDELMARLVSEDVCQALGRLLNSSKLSVKQAAIGLLGRFGCAPLALELLQLLELEELREQTASVLVASGSQTGPVLIEAWPGSDNRIRIYIAYLLGEIGCEQALSLLLEGLLSDEPNLKLVCAQALGKLGQVQAVPQLVDCLGDESADVRETAMRALSSLSQAHQQETLAILEPMFEDSDPEKRMYALQILGQCDGPEVEAQLAFALKDESAHVRSAAVRAFEGRGGEGRLQSLMLALTDEDPEVRRLAAEVLGSSGEPQAVDSLELALQDGDIWVRTAAVRSLGRLDGPRALGLVQRAVEDKVGLVIIAALETLEELDPEAASPFLARMLGHHDDEVAHTALKLLYRSQKKDWIAPVRDQLLNHAHWEIRLTMARASAELEGVEAIAGLEQRLLVEGEPMVRDMIQDLLLDLKVAQG